MLYRVKLGRQYYIESNQIDGLLVSSRDLTDNETSSLLLRESNADIL